MSSDILELRESVNNYWHNSCNIHHLKEWNITIVIHKNRQTIVYVGEWNIKTNLPHGKGKQYKSIGKCDRDEGYLVNGKIYLCGKVSHKGIWNNGLYEGFGFHWYPDGTMYKGFWKDNKFHGYGTLYKSNKEIDQKGTWEYGQIYNGYGKKVLYKQKTYFIGDIENGYITSNGKFYNIYDNKLIE